MLTKFVACRSNKSRLGAYVRLGFTCVSVDNATKNSLGLDANCSEARLLSFLRWVADDMIWFPYRPHVLSYTKFLSHLPWTGALQILIIL